MLYSLARPLLFRCEAETAHGLTLALLDVAHRLHLSWCVSRRPPPCPVQAMGLSFPNPVGLAAGLDKNAEHIDALASLGFGFIEVGTVTPRPQPGNPRPRLFRIPEARAVINRFGFNNLGVDRLLMNVRRARYGGVLGINIGKNFDTPMERAAQDYLTALRKVYAAASYVTINISSPNTKNLRQLQDADVFNELLAKLKTEQAALQRHHGRYTPLVVKIAPDLSAQDIQAMARLVLAHGIDGVIATNTTISRRDVEGLRNAHESGGLSGAPLRHAATQVIAHLHAELGDRVPIIGVGGIMDADSAQEKIKAGARLVQLYTGLVYRGPALVREAVRAIAGETSAGENAIRERHR